MNDIATLGTPLAVYPEDVYAKARDYDINPFSDIGGHAIPSKSWIINERIDLTTSVTYILILYNHNRAPVLARIKIH